VVIFAAFAFGCGMKAVPVEDKANAEANGGSSNEATAKTNNDPAAETSGESKATAVTGACANEYYPIDPSVTRNFEVTGAESNNYTLTQKDFTETGFK